jgi:HTH-like domain
MPARSAQVLPTPGDSIRPEQPIHCPFSIIQRSYQSTGNMSHPVFDGDFEARFAWWREKSRVMAHARKYSKELLDVGARLVFESGRPSRTSRGISVSRARRFPNTFGRPKLMSEGQRKDVLSNQEREEIKAPRQRDPEGRERVFRERARSTPSDVSAFIEERFPGRVDLRDLGRVSVRLLPGRHRPTLSTRDRGRAAARSHHRATRMQLLRYRSRRMWKALLRSGERVGRSRVERLMRENALQGAKRHGKPWRTTLPDPAALRSPDRATATSRLRDRMRCGSPISPT